MISEEPVIRHVELEVLEPSEGFMLGLDKLGEGRLGSSAPPNWVAYLGHATSLVSTRGAKRDGITNTIQVGTLNVVIKDAADPGRNPVIRPGTRVRFMSRAAERELFTGNISDLEVESRRVNGKLIKFVTISVVDSVADHANTMRYGAIAPNGFERWEERIQRLSLSSVVPIELPQLDEPVVRYAL